VLGPGLSGRALRTAQLYMLLHVPTVSTYATRDFRIPPLANGHAARPGCSLHRRASGPVFSHSCPRLPSSSNCLRASSSHGRMCVCVCVCVCETRGGVVVCCVVPLTRGVMASHGTGPHNIRLTRGRAAPRGPRRVGCPSSPSIEGGGGIKPAT